MTYRLAAPRQRPTRRQSFLLTSDKRFQSFPQLASLGYCQIRRGFARSFSEVRVRARGEEEADDLDRGRRSVQRVVERGPSEQVPVNKTALLPSRTWTFMVRKGLPGVDRGPVLNENSNGQEVVLEPGHH